MAQAQIDLFKKNNKKDVATQTADNSEFFVSLSKNKYAKLYYSESYKDLVLSLNINNSKSFIITRHMWSKLRNHIITIDNQLGNNVSTRKFH